MSWYYFRLSGTTLIVFLLISSTIIASEEIMLYSTLMDRNTTSPGQNVVFTCTTRGSTILEWYSDEYIGADGDLIQIYNSSMGTNVSSGANPDTFAILVSATTENGEIVIVSELHITASLKYPRATVMCGNNGLGHRKNITFITAMNEVTLNSTLMDRYTTSPGQNVVFTCTTRGSTILEWYSDEYIGADGDLIQIYNSSTRIKVSSGANPDTFAILVSATTENGEIVIVSELHITASLKYPTATITCGNNGIGHRRHITFTTGNKPHVQEVALYSTLMNGSKAFSGQSVTFTCTIRGSNILEWYSDEYIAADGDRIQVYNSPTRTNVSSGANPDTFAILVSATTENGVAVIVSELHITASLKYPRAAITCGDDDGTSRSVSFSTTDPPVPTIYSNLKCRTCSCPGDVLEFLCTTEYSDGLIWMSSIYVGQEFELQLTVNSSIGITQTTPFNLKTSAVLLNVSNDNGRIKLTSRLSIVVERALINSVTCFNKDIGTQTMYHFQASDNCDDSKVEILSKGVQISLIFLIIAVIAVAVGITIMSILAHVLIHRGNTRRHRSEGKVVYYCKSDSVQILKSETLGSLTSADTELTEDSYHG